jgi:hypothetical protein
MTLTGKPKSLKDLQELISAALTKTEKRAGAVAHCDNPQITELYKEICTEGNTLAAILELLQGSRVTFNFLLRDHA